MKKLLKHSVTFIEHIYHFIWCFYNAFSVSNFAALYIRCWNKKEKHTHTHKSLILFYFLIWFCFSRLILVSSSKHHCVLGYLCWTYEIWHRPICHKLRQIKSRPQSRSHRSSFWRRSKFSLLLNLFSVFTWCLVSNSATMLLRQNCAKKRNNFRFCETIESKFSSWQYCRNAFLFN